VLPVVYGEADHKDYILETVGCGCAFFDYDNDGWMDIFLLSGSSMAGAPSGASQPLVQEQPRWNLQRRTEKSGLRFTGWGSGVCVGDYNNDGWKTCSARSTDKTNSIGTTATGRLPT